MSERLAALRALRKEAMAAMEKARLEAEALIADVLRRKARIEREFYAIGLALRKLAEPRLYGAVGYRSFEELLRARKIFGRTYAFKLMEVSRLIDRDDAMKLGAEKAYEVIRYVAATPEDDVARNLAKTDAVIGEKRVSDLSVRELKDQTRELIARTRKKQRDPAEREARRIAREAQAALRKAASRGVVASAVHGERGWRVRLEMPLADVPAVLGRTSPRGKGG